MRRRDFDWPFALNLFAMVLFVFVVAVALATYTGAP